MGQEQTKIVARGVAVLQAAQDALATVASGLGPSFVDLSMSLAQTSGLVITLGVGKSGIIAQKFAATLASLSCPAFFVHPCELMHGDAGNIGPHDTVVVFSNRGRTPELLSILPLLQQRSCCVLAIVGQASSYWYDMCSTVLVTGCYPEACVLGLAPTTSTSVALAVADALAVVVSEQRGINAHQYAQSHSAITATIVLCVSYSWPGFFLLVRYVLYSISYRLLPRSMCVGISTNN